MKWFKRTFDTEGNEHLILIRDVADNICGVLRLSDVAFYVDFHENRKKNCYTLLFYIKEFRDSETEYKVLDYINSEPVKRFVKKDFYKTFEVIRKELANMTYGNVKEMQTIFGAKRKETISK